MLGGIFHFIQIQIEHSASKQWRPWPDAAVCDVWSGTALFVYVPQKDARLIWVKQPEHAITTDQINERSEQPITWIRRCINIFNSSGPRMLDSFYHMTLN